MRRPNFKNDKFYYGISYMKYLHAQGGARGLLSNCFVVKLRRRRNAHDDGLQTERSYVIAQIILIAKNTSSGSYFYPTRRLNSSFQHVKYSSCAKLIPSPHLRSSQQSPPSLSLDCTMLI